LPLGARRRHPDSGLRRSQPDEVEDRSRVRHLGGGLFVYYAYDNRGLQTDARFGSLSGPGVGNTWNGFGEQATASTNMGGSAWSLGYGWDADGNRIGVGGIVYAYDGLDRLADIFNGPSTPLVALGYAPDGSVKWMGNDWATTLTAAMRVDRDSAGRLGRVTQEMAGLVSNQTDFAYSPALQIVSRSTSNDAYVWNPPHAMPLKPKGHSIHC
jgi:hypothetical protein